MNEFVKIFTNASVAQKLINERLEEGYEIKDFKMNIATNHQGEGYKMDTIEQYYVHMKRKR